MPRVQHFSYFYNLDNYRDNKVVEREIKALLIRGPAFLDLVECVGNRLPQVRGYNLIKDDSTRSRENIAAYVRDDIPITRFHWIDLRGTWPRTETSGTHEPRSFLVYIAGKMKRLVAHQAPRNAEGWRHLQYEGIVRLADAMEPRKSSFSKRQPRFLTWDSNSRITDEILSPTVLARMIGGQVLGGNRVDNGIFRGNMEFTNVTSRFEVAGVQLESDHKKAIRFEWNLNAHWLRGRD